MNNAETGTSICVKPEIIIYGSQNEVHEKLPIYVTKRSWLKSNSSLPLVRMGPSSINVIECRVPISWRILWGTGVLKDKAGKIKKSQKLFEWALASVNKNHLHCDQFHFQVIDHYMLMYYEMGGWYIFGKNLPIIKKGNQCKD